MFFCKKNLDGPNPARYRWFGQIIWLFIYIYIGTHISRMKNPSLFFSNPNLWPPGINNLVLEDMARCKLLGTVTVNSGFWFHQHTTYIYIYIHGQLGDYMLPIPPIKGTSKTNDTGWDYELKCLAGFWHQNRPFFKDFSEPELHLVTLQELIWTQNMDPFNMMISQSNLLF